jgi:hypothetical protein
MLALGVAACEPSHPSTIPGSAQMLDSGDKNVVHTFEMRGTAYVYDQQAHHLVWSGHIRKGQQVKVDPMKNEITVDGTVVSKGVLLPYHSEQIWFSSDNSGPSAVQEDSMNMNSAPQQ